jgi:hypothetical protein
MKSRKSNAEMPAAINAMRAYDEAGIEPSIAEVLAEPIVHAVMRRDSISEATLVGFIKEARKRLEERAAA